MIGGCFGQLFQDPLSFLDDDDDVTAEDNPFDTKPKAAANPLDDDEQAVDEQTVVNLAKPQVAAPAAPAFVFGDDDEDEDTMFSSPKKATPAPAVEAPAASPPAAVEAPKPAVKNSLFADDDEDLDWLK